MLKRE